MAVLEALSVRYAELQGEMGKSIVSDFIKTGRPYGKQR